MTDQFREAVIDREAIASNTRRFRELTGVPVIAVVKANGYGHGAEFAARAALAGGASHLGVVDLDEALELRRSGIEAPIIAWLHAPGETFERAAAENIELGISSFDQLVSAGAAAGARPLRLHLKIDTGLSRNGIPREEWSRVFAETARLERDCAVQLTGMFSHLSNASLAEDRISLEVFEAGVAEAKASGVSPEIRHLAATQAALELPEARLDAVRVGLGLYGGSALIEHSAAELGLRPAMTLQAKVVSVRRVPAGTGVSYDYTYRTPCETTLALVPLGYADGVPRQASGAGPVAIGGRVFRTAGRIAMDQLVVDVGDAEVAVGDDAVLFGDPRQGAPRVEDWAEAAGTISRDVFTGIGARVPRRAV